MSQSDQSSSPTRVAYDRLQEWAVRTIGRTLDGKELLTVYDLALEAMRENVRGAYGEEYGDVA